MHYANGRWWWLEGITPLMVPILGREALERLEPPIPQCSVCGVVPIGARGDQCLACAMHNKQTPMSCGASGACEPRLPPKDLPVPAAAAPTHRVRCVRTSGLSAHLEVATAEPALVTCTEKQFAAACSRLVWTEDGEGRTLTFLPVRDQWSGRVDHYLEAST